MATYTPPEIVEIILSQLREDLSALSRCSLVNREWLSICRPWQFENVDLSARPRPTGSRHARYLKFMDLVTDGGGRRPGSFPGTFHHCVKRLQLDAAFVPYQVVNLSGAHLPALRTIQIKPGSACLPPYLLSAISTMFSERIRNLDITGVRFPCTSSLVEFVCGFPRLEQLALGDNGFLGLVAPVHLTPVELSARFRLASSFTILRVSQSLGDMSVELVQWLVLQPVKKLEYRSNGWYTIFPSDLLIGVVEALEELDLYFHSEDHDIMNLLCSPKLHFPRLHTLRLKCTLSQVQSLSDWQNRRKSVCATHKLDDTFSSSGLFPLIVTSMDTSLEKLITFLNAPQLTALRLTFLPKIYNKWNEEICTMSTLRCISFENFDKALVAVKGGSSDRLPMFQNVDFFASGVEGNRGGRDDQCFAKEEEGSRCYVLKLPRRLHRQAFHVLASDFLSLSLPLSSAASGVKVQVHMS